ncbi:MAG: DMT family transporter [Betaproteobacteria bacterium]|nr:DMT family transporter [Betaproteobacteria bacterium]
MLPVWVLLFSASMWGLSSLPLKAFAAYGLSGPLLAGAAFGLAGLVSLPLLLREYRQWRHSLGCLVLLAVVGGWGNTAYVTALVMGDVVRVMLLFYLLPAWSVLGGWLFLGERVSRRRGGAVTLALAGAFLVVGGVAAFSTPFSMADAMAVSAGMGFAGNNIIARHAQGIPTASKTVVLFLGCAITALPLALWADGSLSATVLTSLTPAVLGWLVAYAVGWLGLITATWQWSVTRMEAGRAGVISIAELVVALLAATLVVGERMTLLECVGGVMIAVAAILEATDSAAATPQAAIQ